MSEKIENSRKIIIESHLPSSSVKFEVGENIHSFLCAYNYWKQWKHDVKNICEGEKKKDFISIANSQRKMKFICEYDVRFHL